ncbi:MAG: hypothetical protein ACTS8R_07200 [Arsenophonus sp. NC-QC1-MAG3]
MKINAPNNKLSQQILIFVGWKFIQLIKNQYSNIDLLSIKITTDLNIGIVCDLNISQN